MRIAVVCNDTRGGIQPYVALALGLKRAGHAVRAVAPSDLAPMFSGAGLEVTALFGSIEEVLRRSGGAAEKGTLASMRLAARELPRRMEEWVAQTRDACAGAEVVTGGVGGMVLGLGVAHVLGLPFIETHLQPVGAVTDAYPGLLLPNTPAWLGGIGRRMSHRLSELAIFKPFEKAAADANHKVLGLTGRPRAADGRKVLYGFSRHVLEVPQVDARPRHTVGYWTLPAPEGWQPPAGLEAFLSRPGPVVSVGFGSMASQSPRELTALVRSAVRAAGVRAVLLAGWGGLDGSEQGDDLFFAEAIPHDWLFPRVAAVVHHGGAGTTGASFRAGVPAIVVPFTMDQPFWGARVASLGAGPAPLPRRRLTAAGLSEALARTVGDDAMRRRAAELGARIRSEDGVAAAVAQFDAL